MKWLLASLAAVAVVGGVYFFHQRNDLRPPSDSADEGIGQAAPKVTKADGALAVRTSPQGIHGSDGAGIYAEFVEEMGFSPRETDEFFEALKLSNESLQALVPPPLMVGLPLEPGDVPPVPPAPIVPEELELHLMESEFLLSEALGADGYEKLKAFRTTLPARTLINEMGGGRNGIKLDAEQKASVLYGAYEDIQSGELPRSPEEFASALTDAVLDRSADYLSGTDQERLAKALKDSGSGGMGPGGPLPTLPGMADLPSSSPGVGVPVKAP